MKCLLVAINAKYIHSCLAVYLLKACAEREFSSKEEVSVELAEYTINHHAAEILDDIYLHHADAVCFSCYIWNIDYVKSLVRDLKRLQPELNVWLGGPEVSYECEQVLEDLPEADGILYREGEYSFPGLLRYLSGERELPEGAVFRDGGRAIIRTKHPGPTDMNDIPFVYGNLSGFENRILYYETMRGCPFSCSYCLSSVDKHLRFRSLERVKKELDFFLEKRVPQVKFVDRTFNCNRDRALAVWTYLRDHDNGVTNFHFEIAADLMDEEELKVISSMRPGLIQLETGVQTANPDTIAAIHRKMDLERVKAVTKQIQSAHNVHQHLDLIAGLPKEDYESFGHSFDEVFLMRPDELQLGFLKVLKGAPVFYETKEYGIVSQAEPPYEVLKTDLLSHEDVIRLKSIEEVTEVFFNSGQFSWSLAVFETLFDRPFSMFELLGAEYRRSGMDKKKYSRASLYEFFLKTVETYFPKETDRFRQLLTVDYYLRENAGKRPEFAGPEEAHKKELREAAARAFPEMSMKEIAKDLHAELVTPPLAPKEECWIFDYRKRDPLSGNAEIIRLRNCHETV